MNQRARRSLQIALVALAVSACAPRFIHMDRSYERPEVVTPPVPPPVQTTPEGDGSCARAPRELWSQAVYSPDPEIAEIARAWPRGVDEVATTIGYCINAGGRTEAIQVERRSGVDAIDRAWMRVIEKWRSKPHVLGGAPVRVCTAGTFRIRAIRPRRRG